MQQKRKFPRRFFIIFIAVVVFLVVFILLVEVRKVKTEELEKGQVPMELDKKEALEFSVEPDQPTKKREEIHTKEQSEKNQRIKQQKLKEAGNTPDAGEQLSGGFKGEPVTATGEGAGLNFDEYYWGKKRYTEYTANYLNEDMQWREFVTLKNNESMKKTMGANYGPERLLESYLEQHDISAKTATVLLDRYGGTSEGREEYYVQFDDKDSTLVTIIYYRAINQHGCYMDVLPCQYTEQEVQQLKNNQKFMKKNLIGGGGVMKNAKYHLRNCQIMWIN